MRKHSPCQVIFSVPYTFTTLLFSDSVLGPQPSPSMVCTETWRQGRGQHPKEAGCYDNKITT